MPLSVCDDDNLAAFSPHICLSFVKTLLPQLGRSQFLQPSPWIFLCPRLALPLWGSTFGCLCGQRAGLSQAARIDNCSLFSFFPPFPPPLVPLWDSWCCLWVSGSPCCRRGVLPLGQRTPTRPVAPASLKGRRNGYTRRYPLCPLSISIPAPVQPSKMYLQEQVPHGKVIFRKLLAKALSISSWAFVLMQPPQDSA